MAAAAQDQPILPKYLLDGDIYSRYRLNLQHFLVGKSQGYLLHPDIRLDKPDLAIADVGTGTGIWLLDLADQLPPSATLRGYDVRLDQYPPKPWLPPNIELDYLDITKDLPPSLEGKFDVVNVRFFVFVVRDDVAVRPVLRNLIKMLKPGGYLQWLDAKRLTADDIVSAEPMNSVQGLHATSEAMARLDSSTKSSDWITRLGDFYRAEGLQDIQMDLRRSAEHNKKWLSVWSEIIVGIKLELLARLPPGEIKDQLAQSVPWEMEDGRAGAAWNSSHYTWIGRKPTATSGST